jgi:PIN domain nuclease of toxin-antitoxin system
MTTPLLLDTCAAIWMNEDRLSARGVDALTERYRQGVAIFVSPITALELGRLFAAGRLRSAISPAEYLKQLFGLPGVQPAEMPAQLLFDSSFLPGSIHKDPADRIIAATAREFGFTVMTCDRALLAYAAEGYLSAVEC